MDKALSYLALARKAGLAELGEEPVCNASTAGKAKLILVASDASEHTFRKAQSLVSGTSQQLVRLPYTKDEMGFAIGRTSLAIAAITDAGMGASLVKALERSQELDAVAQFLTEEAKKRQKRPGKTAKKQH